MSDEKTIAIAVAVVCVAVVAAIYYGTINSEQTDRACIAAGNEVLLGNCIRRAK